MKYFKFDSFKTQSTLAKRTVKKKKGQKEEEIEKKNENEREKLKLLTNDSYTRLRVMNAMIFIIVIKHARVNIRLPYFFQSGVFSQFSTYFR